MKKTKLFMTIASMCFALAVLVFGVFAARQITYEINGTITYDVKDCYILVESKVYYNLTYLTQDQMYSQLEDIVNDDDYGTLQLDSSYMYNSYTDTYEGANHQEIDIQFRGGTIAPRLAYFIVLKTTNLGSNQINLAVNTPADIPYNVYSINSGLLTNVGQDEEHTMVIAFSIEDVKSKITTKHPGQDPTYSVSLKADLDNEDSELNVFDFDTSTQTISKTEKLEDMAIDLCVPSYVDGTKVRTLGSFADCENLTSIFVPTTITSITQRCFSGCKNLQELSLPFMGGGLIEYDGYSKYHLLNYFEDYDTGKGASYDTDYYSVCITDDISGLLPSSLETINLLYGCTSVQDEAFESDIDNWGSVCNITTINYPYSVTSIGSKTFAGLNHLTSINSFVDGVWNIHDNITEIGGYAFQWVGISELILPSITSIGGSAFEHCDQLTHVYIGPNLSDISILAFHECTSLESIEFSEGVTYFDYGAFQECTSLTEITLPSTMNWYGRGAFVDCPNLKTVYLKADADGAINDGQPFFYSWDTNDYYFADEDGYRIYVPDNYFINYAQSGEWSDYINAGVIRSMSSINAYTVDYQVATGGLENARPYINVMVRDPQYWGQFNASVVARDKMGDDANFIYTDMGDNGLTNAIYSDIDIIPSDTIHYGFRVDGGYKAYIYFYDINNDNKTLVSEEYQMYYEFEGYETEHYFYFGMGVNKIRLVLVRFDDSSFSKAKIFKPSQIRNSSFHNTRLSPHNLEGDDSPYRVNYIGYYKPGCAFKMPNMWTSPYTYGYNFINWLTNFDDESSIITGKAGNKVVENGTTTVYADWAPPLMELYFKLNFDGTEEYIKINGVNSLYGLDEGETNGYGNKVSVRIIMDAIFAMPEVKSLMASKGISYDSSGYPTNYYPSRICLEAGKRGGFWWDGANSNSMTWVEWDNIDNSIYRFSTGDGYIYLKNWNSASVGVDVSNVGDSEEISSYEYDYQTQNLYISVDPKDIFKRFANETYFVLPKSSYFNQETKAVAN